MGLNGCNRVGVFSTLTNSYALVAVGASENFYRYVEAAYLFAFGPRILYAWLEWWERERRERGDGYEVRTEADTGRAVSSKQSSRM